jgi:rhodanese-related sulfurtransferase
MTEHDTLAELCCELVENTSDAVPQIDPEQLLMLGLDESTILLDVRSREERVSEGFIPGDTHVPLDDLEQYAEAVLFGHLPTQADLDKPIVCYCAGGVRSITAAAKLQALGCTNPLSMIGGMAQFARIGGPIEKPL